MVICAVFVVPLGVASAVYLEEYADRDKWWNRARSRSTSRTSPRCPPWSTASSASPSSCAARSSLGRVAAGRRRSRSRPARAPGRDHRRARGDPRRAALDPRGLAGAGRDAVADDLEAGAARARSPASPRASSSPLSRAIGETAPLLVIGAAVSRASTRTAWLAFTALPIQIFAWTQDADREFVRLAAGAILVLMVVLLLMNSIAICPAQPLRAEVVIRPVSDDRRPERRRRAERDRAGRAPAAPAAGHGRTPRADRGADGRAGRPSRSSTSTTSTSSTASTGRSAT